MTDFSQIEYDYLYKESEFPKHNMPVKMNAVEDILKCECVFPDIEMAQKIK